jgi:monoamine oxidase
VEDRQVCFPRNIGIDLIRCVGTKQSSLCTASSQPCGSLREKDRYFWEDERLNGFGTSDKNFEVWHPTHGKLGRRGLLQAYVFEDYARRLDEMSEGNRIERMIGDMDEVHPGLRQHLETVVTKSGVNDPWQKGAYTVYQPGQQEWYPDICKREGRVWFAGEHASPYPAWMQGALVSGIKAAREINTESKFAM